MYFRTYSEAYKSKKERVYLFASVCLRFTEKTMVCESSKSLYNVIRLKKDRCLVSIKEGLDTGDTLSLCIHNRELRSTPCHKS